MNLTWHIVKKDFRRLWLPLALWVGLILGQEVLSFMLFRWADEDVMVLQKGLMGLDGLHEVLWGMQLVLGFFLAAGLVQEDSLVGQQTWWVTRPITGSRLLAAKLVGGILFLGILPLLALLPWWLFCGYGAGELLWASVQILVGQAAVSLLAFALAALTANYSRLVVVLLVTVVAWFCSSLPIFTYYFYGLSWGVGMTRVRLVAIVAIVALVMVILHQFRTRASRRSWAILATGFALMLLVLRFAPWDLTDWFAGRGREPTGLAGVIATPGPVEFGEKKQMANDDESLVAMYAGTRFEGMPRGIGFNGGQVSGTLRWPDGSSLERRGRAYSYFGPVAWELMGASNAATKPLNSRGDMGTAPSVLASMALPRSYAVRLREHAPAWDAQFKLNAYAGEVVAEVPLKPGARGGRSGHLIDVREVIKSKSKERGLTLTIAETEPVLDYDDWPGILTTANRRGISNTYYALVSRDRSKIAMVGDERLIYTMTGTVGIMQRRIAFAPGFLANPTDPDWLKDAVLMKVVFHRTGTIIRHAHTDALQETEFSRAKFKFPPAAPKSADVKPTP